MPTIKYDIIPEDALVDIQISGQFYKRMVELLTMLAESVPLEDFKKVLEKLSSNKPAEDMFEFNVHTMMSLIYEVEKQAKDQKKFEQKEMEVPEEAETTGN
jgi:hypothetical protein